MKKRKVVRVNLMQTQIDTLFKLRDELAAANSSGSLGAIIGQPVIDNTGLAVTVYVKFTVLTPAEAAAIAKIMKDGVPDD